MSAKKKKPAKPARAGSGEVTAAERAFRSVTGCWLLVKEYKPEAVHLPGGRVIAPDMALDRPWEGRVVSVGDQVTRFHLGQDVFWKPTTGYDRPGVVTGDVFVVLDEKEVIGTVDRAARKAWLDARDKEARDVETDAGASLAAQRAAMLDPQLPQR